METCLSLIIAPVIVGIILLFIEHRSGWFSKQIENYRIYITPERHTPSSNKQTTQASSSQRSARAIYPNPNIQQNPKPTPTYSRTINPDWSPGFLDTVRQDLSKQFNVRPNEVEIHGWIHKGITHYELLVKTPNEIEVMAEVPDWAEAMGESMIDTLPPIYREEFKGAFKSKQPKQFRKTWANTFKALVEHDGKVVSVFVVRE